MTEIALHPLSPEESTLLVRNLVQRRRPARLVSGTPSSTRAEGNPFFVEEVVRSLIDLGGLVRDEATGRWRVTDQATRISIPDTLQGVIMARVDRLDEDLKQVLRLASVIGRSFFYRVLDSIAEAERDLDRSLADLEARELVQEKARDPELEYIFKHALVQEATYESILLQRRRELHRRVARAPSKSSSPTAWRSSTACSPTTTPRRRTGRRPRSTSSRPGTKRAASRPTPRRWRTTRKPWKRTPAPSEINGTRSSGRLSSARWGKPSTAPASTTEPGTTCAALLRR